MEIEFISFLHTGEQKKNMLKNREKQPLNSHLFKLNRKLI